jgi:hypothetical protein
VLILAWDSGGSEDRPLCPSCIEYLGRRNPSVFPTIEEWEEARKRYPEPIFDYEPPDDIWSPVYNYEALKDRETLTSGA